MLCGSFDPGRKGLHVTANPADSSSRRMAEICNFVRRNLPEFRSGCAEHEMPDLKSIPVTDERTTNSSLVEWLIQNRRAQSRRSVRGPDERGYAGTSMLRGRCTRFRDVDVISGPRTVETEKRADIVELSSKQEPNDVVSILDYRLSSIVQREAAHENGNVP